MAVQIAIAGGAFGDGHLSHLRALLAHQFNLAASELSNLGSRALCVFSNIPVLLRGVIGTRRSRKTLPFDICVEDGLGQPFEQPPAIAADEIVDPLFVGHRSQCGRQSLTLAEHVIPDQR